MAMMTVAMLRVVVRFRRLAAEVLNHDLLFLRPVLRQTQHGSSHRAPHREHDHEQHHQPDTQVFHGLSLSRRRSLVYAVDAAHFPAETRLASLSSQALNGCAGATSTGSSGTVASTAGLQRLSNKALLTTLTLLKAMAAPAKTGLRRPRAARGMPSTL